MIAKEYGRYNLICDICGMYAEDGFDTFQNAVDYGKENEWERNLIITGTEKVWQNICPECKD
ncbi:MAG: hypothetical protein JRI72_00255 [Deltaproteobacteria bacterium]|nr:hypothetical protein [Deltaproteobacteria bacterium]